MKLTKVERSNRVHSDLMYKAIKKSYDPNINYQESLIWDKKYVYHQKMIDRQKQIGRVLTKPERKKIWKNTRPDGF